MGFINDFVVTEVTHASVVSYKKNEGSRMVARPWYGIAFSLGGELTYRHNNEDFRLFGNKVMFLPKGTTYDVICNAGGEFAVINFLTDKEYNITEFAVHEMNDAEKVRDEFFNMNRIFAYEPPFGFYSILSSLYGIFACLVSDLKKDRIPSVLEKALCYINSNIASTGLTNSSVARSVGISEVYLRKLFAKHLSVPVGEYVIDARIKRAKTLLSETNLTVTEISERCGYSSVYYFCSAFKSRVGYTPTVYRVGRRSDVI